ncbi:MAG: RagB/SusD family nutrient uptake outer membrane protein, partial [Bacteroidota bacterium]|nr:RagB/SusD family nutrient uptake outer membrane protein [Bacteroidota bacterium]
MIVLIVTAFSQSCTNLDEELYSEVTPENFFQTEEEFISALGAAYTQFKDFASGGPQAMHETSTDEMVVPTRGQDWDDGGHWRRMHLHSWTYEDPNMNGGWNFGFSGVSTANRLIFTFESLVESGQVDQETADAFIAELETVRGFFYWQLIDIYGNVPLTTDFSDPNPSPPTVPRADVYNFIVGNLETAVPKLSEAVDGTTYGRMNLYAGYTLLAKLYLNAEVYTGIPQWEKVLTACDEVINDGLYSLENDYFTNFNVENSGSNEFIFAIPYDQVFFKDFNIAVRSLHYGSQQTYNLTQQPWNGFCSLEEFYNSYEDTDLRKGDVGTVDGPAGKRGNFISGYQYTSGGVFVTDIGFEVPNPDRVPPFLGDPDGEPLNFGSIGSGQPQINELGPQALRQAGVRIGKWEIAQGSDPGNMNNDYAVFRYADVLLMKAEALWRSGKGAEALPLVNLIRSRAGVPDLTTLDGPLSFDMAAGDVDGGELFNEIGREMFAENHRRQDLIRWGFFTEVDKWVLPFYNAGDVLETGAHTTLFPIHRDKI